MKDLSQDFFIKMLEIVVKSYRPTKTKSKKDLEMILDYLSGNIKELPVGYVLADEKFFEDFYGETKEHFLLDLTKEAFRRFENSKKIRTPEYVAHLLYKSGKKPTFSTNIANVITAGYGKLDSIGEFEFPLEVDQETLQIREIY